MTLISRSGDELLEEVERGYSHEDMIRQIHVHLSGELQVREPVITEAILRASCVLRSNTQSCLRIRIR